MNDTTVKLKSVMKNNEELEQTRNESDVVEEILNCIKAIKQNIASNKEVLR